MKNVKIVIGLFLILACMFLIFTGCTGKDTNSIEGVWKTDVRDGTRYYIFTEDEYIILLNKDETSRGIYTINYEGEGKEKKYFVECVEKYKTVEQNNYPEFADDVSESNFKDKIYYRFDDKKNLIFKNEIYQKTKFEESDYKSVNDIFERRKLNPDMRETTVRAGNTYSLKIKYSEAQRIIWGENIDNFVKSKEKKNGVYKDNKLNWYQNNLVIICDRFWAANSGKLQKGDEIIIAQKLSMSQLVSEESWLRGIYDGPNIDFNHLNSRWGGFQDHDVWGYIDFSEAKPKVVVREIMRSEFI